jgi:hypothetical protein
MMTTFSIESAPVRPDNLQKTGLRPDAAAAKVKRGFAAIPSSPSCSLPFSTLLPRGPPGFPFPTPRSPGYHLGSGALGMALMKALDEPQEIVTSEGKVKLTHEAYCFTIVPYAFPPVQVRSVRGHIDRMGRFKPMLPMETSFEISQEEYRLLISPTPQGKPAGDFRISDVIAMWRKRNHPPEPEGKTAAKAESKADAAPAFDLLPPPV